MDEEKKEEKESEDVTKESETATTEGQTEDTTATDAENVQQTVEDTTDWKKLYQDLLAENNTLKEKYKQRFTEGDNQTDTLARNVALAENIGTGQADETKTYEDLFTSETEEAAKALKNVGIGAGKAAVNIAGKVAPKVEEGALKVGEKLADNNKTPSIESQPEFQAGQKVGEAIKTGVRKFEDLFSNEK